MLVFSVPITSCSPATEFLRRATTFQFHSTAFAPHILRQPHSHMACLAGTLIIQTRGKCPVLHMSAQVRRGAVADARLGLA